MDIVCIGGYWNEFQSRRQHFMRHFFAEGNNILYVEPTFYIGRRPPSAIVCNNRLFVAKMRILANGFTILTPPQVIPFPYPKISRYFHYKWLSNTICRAVRRLNMREVLLWVYDPRFGEALNWIPHKYLIYDMVDDLAHPDYGGKRVLHGLKLLFSHADLVVFTSKILTSKYGRYTHNYITIPNGVDTSLFNIPHLANPPDLSDIPIPRLGFVGTMFRFIDYDLIRIVAEEYPDYSIVLIGRIEGSTYKEIDKLRSLPNIYVLGHKSHDQIPAYINGFQVCLNPFKMGEIADSVSPLKVYEYLACGKPVVSTRMKALELEEISSQIYFANNPHEFRAAIKRAIEEDTAKRQSLRKKIALRCSWNKLFEKLSFAVRNVIMQ